MQDAYIAFLSQFREWAADERLRRFQGTGKVKKRTCRVDISGHMTAAGAFNLTYRPD